MFCKVSEVVIITVCVMTSTVYTWKTASSPSNSSSDGRLLTSSSGPGSIPGGQRKSQSDTPMTWCSPVVSGATACKLCWLMDVCELERERTTIYLCNKCGFPTALYTQSWYMYSHFTSWVFHCEFSQSFETSQSLGGRAVGDGEGPLPSGMHGMSAGRPVPTESSTVKTSSSETVPGES